MNMASQSIVTTGDLLSGLSPETLPDEEVDVVGGESPTAQLDPDIFTDADAPERKVIDIGWKVAPTEQEKVATQISAELSQLQERGIDPRSIYKQEQGIFGPKDVFGYNIEKGFSPKVREFVRRYYGPAEMQYDPKGSLLGNLWTRIFGSAPTEEEKEQIAQAQILAARGDTSASERYKRAISESLKGAPSPAELRGAIPKEIDIPPWLQKHAKARKRVELPKFQARVLLRDYGVRQGSDVDQEIVEKSRVASNWLNQLESISPGLAKNTLGPILAEDFNIHYGLKGTDNEVTAESLNVRQIDWQGSPKLIYDHPETKQPTLFDPVKLELRDVAEVLPELMVLGGDIGGMLLGTPLGALVGPKTALAGNILGGMFGAYYGRMKSYQIALEKNNFALDPRYGGFVKDGYNDEQGNPKVITENELYLNALPDAFWSLGGNIGVRGIFKLGKMALYGPSVGKDALQGSLTVDEFSDAVRHFKTTRLGMAADQAGTPAPTSVVLQKRGEDLIEQSYMDNVGIEDARNLFELGQKFIRQAEVLRASEAGTPAASAREILREETIKEGEAEVAVTSGRVISARSEDIAVAVEKGLPVTATRDVTEQLDNIIVRNEASLAEIDTILGSGSRVSATELGEALAAKSKAIMGDPSPAGRTGVYGIYNRVVEALSKPAFTPGVPLKPFELSSVAKEIDKLQKRSGALRGGFPSDFLSAWNQMTGRVGTKKGKLQGTINVDYRQMKDLIISFRNELGSNGNLTHPQRTNISSILSQLEEIQIRGLQAIDDAGLKAGQPTSFARQIQSADKHFSELAEIWQRGFTKGLEEGTYFEIADKLFKKGAPPEFIGKVLGHLKPGKDQLKLMRNTLLYRYKEAMEGLARGELKTGKDIAGQRVRIGLAADTLTVTEANQAVHRVFLRENDSWIKALFKDGEFDKLTQEVTNVTKQARDLQDLANWDKTFRTNPIFKGEMVKINQDLSKVAVEAPERLVDEIYKLDPGPRATAFKELYKAFKGLPKLERELAEENMRALLFRKLLRPDELIAGMRDEPFDAFRISSIASTELKANSSVYDLVFGEVHRKNLEKIFRGIGTLSRTESAPALEAIYKQKLTGVPLATLKVYVGVLNRRARALTQGQKRLGEFLDRKFREALLDSDKAEKLVRMRNTSLKTKFGLNAFGQLLGIEIGEAIDAVDTFGIDIDRYPNIPKAGLTGVALGVE
jgi:hypothetical protein